MPTVLLHCWLGVWKSIQHVKLSDEVLVWLSVWSEVAQIVCIWSELTPLPSQDANISCLI